MSARRCLTATRACIVHTQRVRLLATEAEAAAGKALAALAELDMAAREHPWPPEYEEAHLAEISNGPMVGDQIRREEFEKAHGADLDAALSDDDAMAMAALGRVTAAGEARRTLPAEMAARKVCDMVGKVEECRRAALRFHERARRAALRAARHIRASAAGPRLSCEEISAMELAGDRINRALMDSSTAIGKISHVFTLIEDDAQARADRRKRAAPAAAC